MNLTCFDGRPVVCVFISVPWTDVMFERSCLTASLLYLHCPSLGNRTNMRRCVLSSGGARTGGEAALDQRPVVPAAAEQTRPVSSARLPYRLPADPCRCCGGRPAADQGKRLPGGSLVPRPPADRPTRRPVRKPGDKGVKIKTSLLLWQFLPGCLWLSSLTRTVTAASSETTVSAPPGMVVVRRKRIGN